MGSTPIAGTIMLLIRRNKMNGQTGQFPMQIIILIGFVAIMYFLMIRPQRKKDKEIKEMRDSIQVGDLIVTIGGIMGKVVKTKDDSIVLQVGADKTKMEFKKWAISSVEKKADRKAAPREETEKTDKEEPKKRSFKRLGKKEEAEEVKAEAAETAAAAAEAVEETAAEIADAAEIPEAVEKAE